MRGRCGGHAAELAPQSDSVRPVRPGRAVEDDWKNSPVCGIKTPGLRKSTGDNSVVRSYTQLSTNPTAPQKLGTQTVTCRVVAHIDRLRNLEDAMQCARQLLSQMPPLVGTK